MTAKSKEKLCNQECVDEAVRVTGEKPELVRDVMRFVWGYAREVIDSGSLEEVYLFKFGKFRPRLHLVAGSIRSESLRETARRGRMELERQTKEQRKRDLLKQRKEGGGHAG